MEFMERKVERMMNKKKDKFIAEIESDPAILNDYVVIIRGNETRLMAALARSFNMSPSDIKRLLSE